MISIISTATWGQTDSLQITPQERPILQSKDQSTAIKHFFKGRIDDVHEVSLSLDIKGKKCKGLLTYLVSNQTIAIEGTLDDQEIRLQEINDNGFVSGFIRGILHENKIIAEWSNFDNSIGSNIELIETSAETPLSINCSEGKWLRRYKGNIEKSVIELIAQRSNNGYLYGIAYFDKQNVALFKGNIDDDGNFRINLKSDSTNYKGWIKGGNIPKSNDWKVVFYNNNNDTLIGELELKNDLPVTCLSFADYSSNYEIIYPKLKNDQFSYWLENTFDNWLKDCQNQSNKMNTLLNEPDASMRSSVRGYIWTEIEFLSSDIISGQLVFNNTWSQQQDKTFNYDIEHGKYLVIKDIFIDGFDYLNFINTFVKPLFSLNPNYQNNDFKEWILQEPFDIFTIRRNGINFSTRFNALYGRQSITIPYEKLMPYLQKNTVIYKVARG